MDLQADQLVLPIPLPAYCTTALAVWARATAAWAGVSPRHLALLFWTATYVRDSFNQREPSQGRVGYTRIPAPPQSPVQGKLCGRGSAPAAAAAGIPPPAVVLFPQSLTLGLWVRWRLFARASGEIPPPTRPPPSPLRPLSSSFPGVLPTRHSPRRRPHPVHPRVCVRGQRGGHLLQRGRAGGGGSGGCVGLPHPPPGGARGGRGGAHCVPGGRGGGSDALADAAGPGGSGVVCQQRRTGGGWSRGRISIAAHSTTGGGAGDEDVAAAPRVGT